MHRDSGTAESASKRQPWGTVAKLILAIAFAAGASHLVACGGTSATAPESNGNDPPPTDIGSAPPDPTLLPLASGQAPLFSEYVGGGLSAGESYRDPTTDVRVWKVSDASTPITNERVVPDYGGGGPHISLPWGPDKTQYTLYLQVRHPGGPNTHYLVDFQLGVGFSNWREAPDFVATSELNWAFSYDPSTPRMAYVLDDDVLHRFDTETMTISDVGNFPHTFAFSGDGGWLQVDRNDEWFVAQNAFGGGPVAAWNSQTDVEYTVSDSDIDEPHLDRNGDYVFIKESRPSNRGVLDGEQKDGIGNIILLDLSDGSTSKPDWPNSHPDGGMGFMFGVDPHQSGGFDYIRYDPSQAVDGDTAGITVLGERDEIVGGAGHTAGQWVHNNGSGTDQWHIHSGWGPPGGAAENNAIIFIRADGTDVRLLAHHYSAGADNDYYKQPHATLSPDGKLVLFGSDMDGQGNGQAFLVEVP